VKLTLKRLAAPYRRKTTGNSGPVPEELIEDLLAPYMLPGFS
jgi:hypothetical protein